MEVTAVKDPGWQRNNPQNTVMVFSRKKSMLPDLVEKVQPSVSRGDCPRPPQAASGQ